METERLLIRKITRKDIDALLAIMGKPEVMYAWEHGFTKKDVRKWINRQLTRYRKDGFGYFAVILKENGTLIGQAGLMKSTITEMRLSSLDIYLITHIGITVTVQKPPVLVWNTPLGSWHRKPFVAASDRKTGHPSGWRNGWE